jgi:hypothetical protein
VQLDRWDLLATAQAKAMTMESVHRERYLYDNTHRGSPFGKKHRRWLACHEATSEALLQ